MDRLRYTASARLGLWDSVAGDRDEVLVPLARLLQDYAHAVLEADHLEFIPTDDADLASITAICDKLIVRGNPTLADFDFEKALLHGPCQPLIRAEQLLASASVGFRITGLQFPGTTTDLLKAAEDLLELPFRERSTNTSRSCPLPFELLELSSQEEEIFLEKFVKAFGSGLGGLLHRQVLIGELVDGADPQLAQGRVDFVFQARGVRWVIEVDGPQHDEAGQADLDNRRDALLKGHGWTVFRIPTAEVRNVSTSWFEARQHDLQQLAPSTYPSIVSAVAQSQVHAAAYYAILLPLATHRCLRGLLHLFSHELLDPHRPLRILVLEEDMPVCVEAFRQLVAIWGHLHTLAPGTPPSPQLILDVIGEPAVHAPLSGIVARAVVSPEEVYDLVLSHAFLLPAGVEGLLEDEHLQPGLGHLIRLRKAVGHCSERSLQWCQPLYYDLADVELAITSENSDTPQPMPEGKRAALRFLLRQVFRKRDFWDGQLRVISRLLQGKTTIALLPTGGGKSLTYQFSGLILPGMTIIIDPLVSLMADQAENLYAAGLDQVGFISSQLDPGEKEASLRDMEGGRLAFTYVSPERLQIQQFRNQLQTVVARFPVSLAVIDEAHCVSEWGHDFRPSYLHLPLNLQRYCSGGGGAGPPTLVGLTGTASFAVLTDIQMEMQIADEDAVVLPKSFDRQELRFDIRIVPMAAKPSALKTLKQQLPRILRANPQHFYNLRGDQTNCGIVFCPHVNGSLGVTFVAGTLGHSSYFAGRLPKSFSGDQAKWHQHKRRVQHAFKSNRVQELVATKSFGMGIDKPNIRYTIHYAVPQSVEAFYQEAGRAGRNGIRDYALCSIIYSDDNWDAALAILNEPEHPVALAKLEAINWGDRGDLLVQLWLMFHSYRGRNEEKSQTLNFWDRHLAPAIKGMPVGSTNTREIPFGGGEQARANNERAIFRLMLLGVVQDYTIDWSKRRFAVRVHRITPAGVKVSLSRYLLQYKFQDFADATVHGISEETVEAALRAAINVLIDFIYDEIVAKRKQALRTMAELCRNFSSDQEFREAILAYLQESEFSGELREWLGRNFEAIGASSIHDVLGRVTTLDEVKRLVGTTRRMLDEDPQNIALRYLSICARAQSAAESDSSVLQEATTLAILIDRQRDELPSVDDILLSLLKEIAIRRPSTLAAVGDRVLRLAGSDAVARMVLASDMGADATLYPMALKLLAASTVDLAAGCTFYKNLPEEPRHA